MKVTSVGCTAYPGTVEHPGEFRGDRALRPAGIYPPFGISNRGGTLVAANTISGPPPARGTTRPANGGQPSKVSGPATGQCAPARRSRR